MVFELGLYAVAAFGLLGGTVIAVWIWLGGTK
jgi:hypothetical protein